MDNHSLNIAVDAKRLFQNREGLGSYARTLMRDMITHHPEHNYFLCTPEADSSLNTVQVMLDQGFKLVTPPEGKLKGYWRRKGITKQLVENKIDVYWGLSNELPGGLDKAVKGRVVTIHDLLFKKFPSQFSIADRWIYAYKFKQAVSSAKVIIATSQSTKQDLLEYYPKARSKVEVLYQSVGEPFRNQPAIKEMSEDYHLMVGTVNERKNLELVVRAYGLLPQLDRIPVEVVGRQSSTYGQKIRKLIASLGLDPWFRFRSHISEKELIKLYGGARSLLFPSKYEGFGIPIIEALSQKVPVIGNDISSIPEVMGKHGIIIEYNDAASLVKALTTMRQPEKRNSLLNGVEKHLLSFDSEKVCGQAMKAIIKSVG